MMTTAVMPVPDPPSWFKQRQAKMEPAGNLIYKLTAPQLDDYWITIRRDEQGLWSAHLLKKQDGPEVDSTRPIYDNPLDAWGAAFELYRVNVVV